MMKLARKCKTFSRAHAGVWIERVKSAIYNYLNKNLEGVESIAGTADGWSDKQRRKIIAFTGHWLDSEWEHMQAVLGVEELIGGGSAENLETYFNEMIGRWKYLFWTLSY